MRSLTAILPNGRLVWLRVGPPLAPAIALNRVGLLADLQAERRQAASRSQGRAVARLSRTMAAGVEGVTAARLARARALRRRIVAGDAKVNRRLARAAEEHRARVERQQGIEVETVHRLRRRDLWDKIVIASSMPLFAAYGQPGRPFAAGNVALTLSLLIWLGGEAIVDALFGKRKASPYAVRDIDAWSCLAPIGNLLAGYWLLHDQQHQRFVGGRTPIPPGAFTHDPDAPGPGLVYRKTVFVDLSATIAPAHFPDFVTFKSIPVVAAVASATWPQAAMDRHVRTAGVTAEVLGGTALQLTVSGTLQLMVPGTLQLTVTAITDDPPPGDPIPDLVGSLDVAWILDTAKPAAAPTS